MDEVLAQALELDAATVAGSPLLGYRIVEVTGTDRNSPPEMLRQLRLCQPWIETENTPVTIDIEMFWAFRPLADLVVDRSEASGFVTSVSEALTDFESRWAISSLLHDRVDSSDSEGLAIVGGDAEALVWREGVVIGAQEPLATALKLLIADFSEAARQTYVYSKPQLLTSALALLPDEVKSQYVPGADNFIGQAKRELDRKRHQLVLNKQEALKSKTPRLKINPRPKSDQ
jgi:hypothetical protein